METRTIHENLTFTCSMLAELVQGFAEKFPGLSSLRLVSSQNTYRGIVRLHCTDTVRSRFSE